VSVVGKLRSVVKQAATDRAFVDAIEKSGDQIDFADGESMGSYGVRNMTWFIS